MSDPRRTAAALVVAVLAVATTVATATAQDRNRDRSRAEDDRAVNPRWLDRMPAADRQELEASVGYAPPEVRADVTWLNTPPVAWKEFVGKVVILQSWTSATSKGRRIPTSLDRIVESLGDEVPRDDIRILLLHTPEGADGLQKRLERAPVTHPILLDGTGKFCDDLGIFKDPVNLIIDRNGAVRYAGLSSRGLREALPGLLAEPFTIAAKPKPEPKEPEVVAFPKVQGSISGAKDFRGQRGPDFHVDEWMTRTPNAAGKVVLIDFWATWCGPCRASIPHLNDLARRFPDDLVVVGISNERERDFDRGLDKYNLKPADFAYSLALDPKSVMSRAVNVTGIPHGLVLDSNWVVRWQGHPAGLKAETMRQIVEADRAQRGAAGSSSVLRRRWSAAKR